MKWPRIKFTERNDYCMAIPCVSIEINTDKHMKNTVILAANDAHASTAARIF